MSKRTLTALMACAACQSALPAGTPQVPTEPAAAGSTVSGPDQVEEPASVRPLAPSPLEVSTGDRGLDVLLKARIDPDGGGAGDAPASDRAYRGMPGTAPDPARRASSADATAASVAAGQDKARAGPEVVHRLIRSAADVLGSGERKSARDVSTANDPAANANLPPVRAVPRDGLLAVPGRFFSYIREHRDWVASLAVLVLAMVGYIVWRQGRASKRPPPPRPPHQGSRRRRRT